MIRHGDTMSEKLNPSLVVGKPDDASALRRPRRCYDLWFGRHMIVLAWVMPVIAIFHPPQGLILPLCWMKLCTGVPCPGCGLLRSLSCTVRGSLADAVTYHPFGAVLMLLFAVAMGVSVMPGEVRQRIGDLMSSHGRLLGGAYVLFVSSFLAYGTVRALFFMVLGDGG